VWKLAYVFYGLQQKFNADKKSGSCDPRNMEKLAAWKRATPNSPAPYIIEAQAIYSKAWCIRGGGHGYTVSPHESREFQQTLRLAEQTLQSKREIASQNPQFYSTMIFIKIGQGLPRDQFEDLVEEAVDAEPYYYTTYYSAAAYYEPKWYGAPGDLERFAQFAAKQTEALDGQSAYARIYWHLAQCNCLAEFQTKNWETMKESMNDLLERYPTDWNAANFGRFACLESDSEATAAYLQRAKAVPSHVWTSDAEEQRCTSISKAAAGT
jgi:hypothetical protein